MTGVRRTFLALLAFAACASPASADDPSAASCERREHRRGEDHEAARAALARGEVLPLRRVLQIAERRTPGDVLEIELERRRDGVFVYELRILARDGRVLKQCLNARTGAAIASCSEM